MNGVVFAGFGGRKQLLSASNLVLWEELELRRHILRAVALYKKLYEHVLELGLVN